MQKNESKTIWISEVEVLPIKPANGLVGFASLVINNQLYLGSIGIMQKLDGSGYRLTYPTKKVGDNNLNIYHPINKETSQTIEEAIFNKCSEIFKNDRHNNIENS
jgi:stage V sporulation protein G